MAAGLGWIAIFVATAAIGGWCLVQIADERDARRGREPAGDHPHLPGELAAGKQPGRGGVSKADRQHNNIRTHSQFPDRTSSGQGRNNR